ncbi:uncharacterized protein LOC125028195 isoform X2 [Penaeus chinensis]|uniref:uncharacterized protein LOC125028195 isoform X2 n=1 Tax=Penaeus chinensis TaxID=139456 RepID=UPI001FB6024A|nr:uncharacterized protein LOC125028195 isoform X2 [Penaeus chinensis]
MDKFRDVQDLHVSHQDIFQDSSMDQLSLTEYSEGCSRPHNALATHQAHQPLQKNHFVPFTHETHSFIQPLTLPQSPEFVQPNINSSQPSLYSNDTDQAVLDTNNSTQVCDSNVLHGTRLISNPTIDLKNGLTGNEVDNISKQESAGQEQWKKNIRKKMKNLGKSYTTQNGKKISNGRLSYSLSKKLVAVNDEEPQDKRGSQIPSNKTPAQAVRDAEEYIQSTSYYSIKKDSGAKMLIVPQGVTIRKLYAAYQRKFVESGKLVISLKLFRKLLPPILKKDALNMPLIFSKQIGESSCIGYNKCPANKTVIMKEGVTVWSEKGTCVEKLSRNETDTKQSVTVIQGTKDVELNTHSIMHNESYLSSTNNSARKSNLKLWKRNISKDLRDRGKSYMSSSGKINWGKEFLPQYSCCVSKCHVAFPVEQQETLFKKYWALASWNLQTKFLWDHIQVVQKKVNTSKSDDSRRIHTRIFFLTNNDGEKRKVCKILFCATLQVSNGRVSRAVCSKIVDSSLPPEDKRGKSTPQNKTTRENVLFALDHIDQLLQHNSCLQSISRKCSLLNNISKKKAHDMYRNSCFEYGKKPLSYTVYCRILREDAYCPVENTNSRENVNSCT